MRKTVVAFSPRTVSRVAMISVAALMAAGCSSDAVRFDNAFSNPFASRQSQPEPSYTGTVASAPSGSVSSSPLAPIGSAPQAQYGYQAPNQNYQQASNQTYQPPVAGAVRMGADRDWSLQGGTPVTVGATDSLNTISMRYGVPASAIVATNGLSPTQPLTPGQKIVIPVFKRGGNATVASTPAAPRASVPTVTASSSPRASGASHTVASGETLFSLARTYGVSHRDIAAANGIAPDAQLRLGQSVVIPGGMRAPVVAAARPAQPVQQPAAPTVTASYAPVATAKPLQSAPVAMQTQTPSVEQPRQPQAATVRQAVARPEDATAAASAAQAGKPDFRWPVRGRVISGYGSKPNGKANDGVNLAVPEGTPIRAAESGTVAYAGSELQSFGNMVLIRHADGWVTAYAHASDISVKKGDIVRRGQVIARAGRTGDVSAPQLHFEVRRGSNPVDPLEHLPRS